MPLTQDLGGKKYTLGRGRLFFGLFAPNVTVTAATAPVGGERYIGNTPEFSWNSSSEDLDHYDSDSGIRTKDDSVPLSFDRGGSFTTDNVDKYNLAMLMLSQNGATSIVQVAATGVITLIDNTTKGVFHQLGASASLPAGVRTISSVVVKNGVAFADTVAQPNNYEVDEALGRIYILPNAPDIDEGDELQVTFNVGVSTREQIVSGSTPLFGQLRYVADNPKGENRDIFMPYVKLTPDGDYNLKGDDWQTMTFNIEILKKASNIEAVYADGRPVV